MRRITTQKRLMIGSGSSGDLSINKHTFITHTLYVYICSLT